MAAYLYPNLRSKAEFKRAIKEGRRVTAVENTPSGTVAVNEGVVAFEGPHYPQPHKFYGKATVKDGVVVKIS